MVNILGDKRKSKYNPDLGNIINEKHELERRINEINWLLYVQEGYHRVEESQTPKLARIEKNFLKYLESGEEGLPTPIMSGLKPITRDDVFYFSKLLPCYLEKPGFLENVGFYLSAMMMESKEKHFGLDLERLSKQKNILLDSIGFGLEDKEIGVHGYVGDKFANNSKKCIFEVDQVGKEVGHGSEDCMVIIHFGEMEGFFDADKLGERMTIIRTAGGYESIWNTIHPPR